MDYTLLQQYWWLLISVLGALLVFLLFVQGGQSMIFCMKKCGDKAKEGMLYSIAEKWELTFTVLVTFGGAFFASFPLFYSTSFGGAYWVWMLILFGFILQAVSYKYRGEIGNIFGRKTYDAFLVINGLLAPVLLGMAVAGFFFGNDFTVEKTNLVMQGGGVISQWGSLHGLEKLADWRSVAFGLMVLMLARVQANLWFMCVVDDEDSQQWNKRHLAVNAPIFIVLFLACVAVLLTSSGLETTGEHTFQMVEYKYLSNYIAMPAALGAFLLGTILVLAGIGLNMFKQGFRHGIWFSGIGTVLVVLSLFWVAGYNNTPYYPSTADVASSLTIYNSSSSEFTLQTMSVVSIAIPFVAAYIAWVWWKMNHRSE